MKKKTKTISIISIVMAFIMLLGVPANAVGLRSGYKNPLKCDENSVRFSSVLSGTLADDLEIVGVTVLAHTKTGNVAFEYSDSNSTNVEIGALLNIYIKNNTSSDIYPELKFNGKTACEYLDVYPQKICWANTPDTRVNKAYRTSDEFASFKELTTYIPAGGIDCYSINVTDGNLLYGGLKMDITANGKSASAILYGDYQYISVSRITWTASSGNSYFPDGFSYYIKSNSEYDTKINYIKFYDGTSEYNVHYWNERGELDFDGNDIVPANQPAFGKIAFDGAVDFQEYLVEFNITNNGRTYSIIQKTRPLVYEFDISVGWASGDLKRDSYIKAISSMHFNTVIGAFDSSYYLKSEEFRNQYPIKIFGYNEGRQTGPEMHIENGVVTVYASDDIHASLPFGEPQLNDGAGKQQPMRVFNKLLTYRNAPYATNITLSHEPAFYRFAGLSDLCHYDAYRVIAPFSDAWYHYYEYTPQGKYAIYWGAPLETQGDYMRTLTALNYPNPVAAWTQGANTWDSFPRFTSQKEYMVSPNPFELRMQAYENMANGANALYWFNINGDDLLYHKDGSREMMLVNRELCTASEYLVKQIPYSYARNNNFDLNANITPDAALLFAIDLNYSIKDDMYQYSGVRSNQSFSFDIPDYLEGSTQLVKITKDGVSEIDSFTVSDGKVSFNDTVDVTAMYLLSDDSSFDKLSANYDLTVSKETFDIYADKENFKQLESEYGYSDEKPCVPEAYEKMEETQTKILYTILSPVIHVLEKMLTSFIGFWVKIFIK